MKVILNEEETKSFLQEIKSEILEMIKSELSFTKNNEADELLNKKQVLELIGCSYSTSYKYFNNSDFPKKKNNGKYSKQEITKWLSRNKKVV